MPSKTVLISEAARQLNMSHQQVLNKVLRGKLKAKKEGHFWRVYISAIQAELRRLNETR